MRLVQLLAGVVSLGFGVLLCVPGAFVAALAIPSGLGACDAGSLPSSAGPSDFVLSVSVGGFTFARWQMWALVGGLALGGLFLATLGIRLLWSRVAGK